MRRGHRPRGAGPRRRARSSRRTPRARRRRRRRRADEDRLERRRRSAWPRPRATVSASSDGRAGRPPSCSTKVRIIAPTQPHPDEQLDDRRCGRGPLAEDLDAPLLLGRQPQADLRRSPWPGRRDHPDDLLLLRPEATRDRRVARQVDPLAHGDDRGERQLEDLPAARRLATADRDPVADLERLHAADERQAEGDRDPDPDLVVAAVGRLVAEQEQVVRRSRVALGDDRVDDRRRPSRWDPSRRRRSRAGSPGRRRSPSPRGAGRRRPPGRGSGRSSCRRGPRRSGRPPRRRTPRAG